MSEEHTRNLPDTRSFEERVFARFDALDARMSGMETRMDRLETRMDRLETRMDDTNERLEKLEAESQRRAADTKPIWERALAEIVAVREEVGVISRKLDTIEHRTETLALDVLNLRTDQRLLKTRVDKLDSEQAR